jgi:hypothetical protein
MLWKGREISSPGDYVTALARIETSEEANEFREQMMRDGALDRKIADRNIGYMTGYMAHERGEVVRLLFDVEHPIMGELVGHLSDDELLALGMEFFKYHMIERRDYDESAMLARQAILMFRELRVATTTNGGA